jgi:hypothetical protein
MKPRWEIQGQAGATLDATRRTVEDVGLVNAILTLLSLEVDTLTWTQQSGIIPDDRQTIALFRNGVCVFQGTITKRKFTYVVGGGKGYALVASGALFAASIAQIVDTGTDGTGATAQRPSFQFAPGSLKSMVSRLIAAMPGITEGDISDIDAATVEGSFVVGRQTFTGGTYLSVLIDLLKPLADVAGRVDYSVVGRPTLCLHRRPAMGTVTLQLGVDDINRVDLTPRSELRITGVTLATTTRDATGKTLYGAQTSGDGARLVSYTGPEVGAFVPPDNLPSVAIQTSAVSGAWAEVKVLDAEIAKAITTYGDFTPGGGITLYSSNYTVPGWTVVAARYSALPVGVTIKNDQGAADTGYRFVQGQMIDFLKTDYGAVEKTLQVSGNIIGSWVGGVADMPQIFQSLGNKIEVTQTGYSAPTNGVLYTNYSLSFSYTVQAINLSYPTLQTIYAKAAYEYLTAPANLAENMRRAGDFIPHEGEAVLNPKFPWQQFLGKRLNVVNGDPALATAGALVQSLTAALLTGQVTLKVGAPQRVPLSAVLGRYSGASAKDNIVNL